MVDKISTYGERSLALKINEIIDAINSGNLAGANVLQLETGEPIPTDPAPPAGTFVVRTDPPPVPLAVVPESVTTVRGTSATDFQIPYPTGTQTGDLLIACIVTNSQTTTITPPAGWTLLQQQPVTSDFRSGGIYGYPVTSTPPTGTAFFDNSESTRAASCMFRVTGANLADPVLANGTTGSRATTVYTVPALTGSAGGLVISLTQGNSTTPNNPDPVAYNNALTQLLYLPSVDDLGVTRTWLNVRYMLTAVDLASHTATSPSSVASMGSEVLAIGAAA
jgi:hypothetical protein